MSEAGNTPYINPKPDHRPVPIVAIGGSAGGQQAVTALLQHLPAHTGLAFVYIQHLSPDYDSQLAKILANATPMTVLEAAPLMPVDADHLYIIPPNKDMEIVDGLLVLTPRKPRPHIHMPIDQFFISLAERQKNGAIGIVLSGMASDGTLGLRAIKVAGGVTFAQDETALYNAMPQSAITEGVVDMVLSPKEIAQEITRLSKHAEIFQLTSETEESAEVDMADKDLDKVLSFVKSAVEELLSINEELETSKEEIESANEELQTTNQELQIRNDQLTESYEYSEAILSTISEATLVLDKELRIKNANKAFYRIFRTTPQQTEESILFEVGNGQLDFAGFREMMQNVISRDASVQGFEVNIKLGETGERIMLVHARKVILHQKHTILLVFEDITEHRRAQKLLEERQQWFKELVDNATAFIWVAQADGRVNFFNKAWLDFTGQSFDKDKGHTVFEIIHPEDRAAYQEASSTGIAEGTPYTIEYRLRRRDGEYRWMLESAKPMLSGSGKITGYIGTCTDIHLQKTLTQQLRNHVEARTHELRSANEGLATANTELTRTAQNLQAVLDSSPASIGFFKAIGDDPAETTDFTLAVCNQKFAAHLNEDAAVLIGKKASELYAREQVMHMLGVLRGGQGYYEETYLEKGRKWLGVSITRHDHGIAITQLDISPLKRAQTEQDELMRQLEGSHEMIGSLSVMKEYVQHRGSFLRSAFHDLRGSFGIISGAATVLNIMDTDEDRARTLDMIQRNLGQVAQMMNQLLDYSRLEAGEEIVELSRFDVSQMLTELCEASKVMASKKNLSIVYEGTEGILVESDAVKVRRIAQNLILNALKYTSNGKVYVYWQHLPSSTEHGNGAWQMTVTGPGIPQTLLHKLIGSDTGDIAGPAGEQGAAGLNAGEEIGLFIVKRLCEMLRGNMNVRCAPEEGTTFHIVFPVAYPS